MAEVRIPTDQIPVDILKRLQDILDGRVMVSRESSAPQQQLQDILDGRVMVSRESSAPQQQLASSRLTTCWSSCVVSPTISPPGMAVFADTPFSSQTQCKKSVQTSTPPSYNSQPSSARTSRFETSQATTTPTSYDEVDGGSRHSLFTASSPNKRKANDVLDDSGIVRVFPLADEATSLECQASMDQCDSEIVRIFPEMDRVKNLAHETTIVRALTPTPSRSSDNRQGAPTKDWNPRSINETSGQSTLVSSSSPLQISKTPPRRPASVSHTLMGPFDRLNGFNNTPIKGDGPLPVQTSMSYSPRLQLSASGSDQDTAFSKHLQTQTFIGGARRSPGLPTPPQTPDDVDPDVDDDDVFTYNVPDNEYFLSRPHSRQACRKSSECTPRRAFENLRHHSDRSCERHNMTHLLSPSGSGQNLAEQSFGDRHKTRKRLSFDDHITSQSQPLRPHHHSDPVSPSLSALRRISGSNNNQSHAGTSRSCPHQSSSPASFQHSSHDSSTSVNFCREHVAEPSTAGHQPTTTFHQPTTTFQQQTTATASHVQGSLQSPDLDISPLLETVSNRQPPEQHRRSRLHSEGDRHFRRVASPEVDSPPFSRSQTFSHSKRPRTDVHDGLEQRLDESPANQLQMTWPSDQRSPVSGECACSKIAQNFLQLVEGAYRRVGGAQMGFDRFRQELALTNDILRESLVIVQQFRVMCRHEGMPSLPTTSQR